MIGLFGGSFDPIHHGHLLVAQAVLERLGLDSIRFLVAREQPFKLGQHAADALDRAAMVERAIAGEARFALERAELERPGPSYTVDTLRFLCRREPGSSFALLVGADAAAEIEQWREAAELPGLARIVAFARPGSPLPVSRLIHETVEVPRIDISATAVRERAQSGRSIRYSVPDAVAEYVAAHQLYLGDHD